MVKESNKGYKVFVIIAYPSLCEIVKFSINTELKSHTKIEVSQTEFDVADIKTAGSSVIELEQVNQLPEHQGVTVKVTV